MPPVDLFTVSPPVLLLLSYIYEAEHLITGGEKDNYIIDHYKKDVLTKMPFNVQYKIHINIIIGKYHSLLTYATHLISVSVYEVGTPSLLVNYHPYPHSRIQTGGGGNHEKLVYFLSGHQNIISKISST